MDGGFALEGSPLYPTGGNGAAQAILDARSLARHLASGAPVRDALEAYETERRPATMAIVLASRRGRPERVIDLVEARARNSKIWTRWRRTPSARRSSAVPPPWPALSECRASRAIRPLISALKGRSLLDRASV
jgi:2-polyprenyl-6-methoxyphenol hydroxylase-like FAD-dependent oxidoreductase